MPRDNTGNEKNDAVEDQVRAGAESTRQSDRKERVLHTRIPEALDEEIRAQARELGVSVSNLVRNTLRNTLGLVGDVVEDTATLTRRALGEAREGSARKTGGPSRREADPSPVVAWLEVTLNVNAVCAECNAILERGSDAASAVGGETGAPTLICLSCLERIKQQ